MTTHTHTVSAQHLQPGDLIFESGREVASSVRDMANLGACLVTFTDGTSTRMGTYDAVAIERRDEIQTARAALLTLTDPTALELVQATRFGSILGRNTLPQVAHCDTCGLDLDVSSVGNQTHLALRRLLEHVETNHPANH